MTAAPRMAGSRLPGLTAPGHLQPQLVERDLGRGAGRAVPCPGAFVTFEFQGQTGNVAQGPTTIVLR